MPVTYAVVGATTPTTAWLRPKVTEGPVVAHVATDASFGSYTTHGPVTPSNSIASISVSDLAPNTRYFYRFALNGTIDHQVIGEFRTHPPLDQPAEFTIAASSCAGNNATYPDTTGGALVPAYISNHPVFEQIASRRPLMFFHMGDMHYYNIGSSRVPDATTANYRRAFDDVFLQSRQHNLYRNVATAYVYDDHDFGPNDSDGLAAGRDVVTQVYRERWPHYALGEGPGANPIYQTWKIGRIQFVMLDSRAERSPNSTPDNPSKTLLGDTQIEWLRNVLETTTAKALVIVNPSQWMGTGIDTWASFTYERDRLIEMFQETGWINRMLMVSGDVHSLGIDTGGNSPGGIPVFQFASIDSSFGGPQYQYDTGPTLPGRGQYGTLHFKDNGTSIQITGTCMVGNQAWRSHMFAIQVAPDEIPIDDNPPQPPPAISPELTWYGCNLTTGQIIDEIPEVRGDIGRIIGAVTTASLEIPIPIAGQSSRRASIMGCTTKWWNFLVAVANGVPVWSGIVTYRSIGSDATIKVTCATPEVYFGERYIRDHGWNSLDEAQIMLHLIQDAEQYEGQWRGLNLLLDAPNTGVKRERTYFDSENKRVLDGLEELMAIEDGAEWTVDTVWSNEDRQGFRFVFRVRREIGRRAANPNVQFVASLPSFDSVSAGNATYEQTQDGSNGKQANVVIAYSSGEGDDKPISSRQIDTQQLNAGALVREHRYQPSNNITDQRTLDAHARAELARIKLGSEILHIESAYNAEPRLGYDWDLGDDVAWDLKGHAHPDGLIGRGRVVGWTLNAESLIVKPILWSDDG